MEIMVCLFVFLLGILSGFSIMDSYLVRLCDEEVS